MEKEWLTIKETAEYLLLSRWTVRKLIDAGKIEAKQVSFRKWIVLAESVKNYEYQK